MAKYTTLQQVQADLQSGNLTCRALVNYYLEQIEASKDLNAYVEMSSKKRKGKISSSFDFEDEEEYYRNDDKYVRKWFTKGDGSRKIEIRTGTGRAKIKK